MNYWGYRIDTRDIRFFEDELNKGQLRQGWGYDAGQDLRNMTVDAGAGRNRPMLQVKQGDILFVPRLPSWGEGAIVEATEDWDSSYRFDIPKKQGDYGHIFAAKLLRSFTRESAHVSGDLRSTLRTPRRFWGITFPDIEKQVEKLLSVPESELSKGITHAQRFEGAIQDAFGRVIKGFSESAKEQLDHQFSEARWENALMEVFKVLYPGCEIRRPAGRSESKHGTDILIQIPGLRRDTNFGIAVQVKDHHGVVKDEAVQQVAKAEYWEQRWPDFTLIEKVVLITKAGKKDNAKLVDAGRDADVHVLFADDLEWLLSRYARRRWGKGPD